jgi:hypothetical protein
LSSPNVLTVTPNVNAVDVVLGISIVVTFDSLMDTTTINSKTFSLTGPSSSQILTPNQLIQSDPDSIMGRPDLISGSYAFTTDSNNHTVFTFTPSTPFNPNSIYTVLLVGSGALLIGSTINDINGNALSSNYRWSFTTGVLNTKVPPLQSPLPYQLASIDPTTIKVRVNGLNPGNLLNQNIGSSYEIDLIFPVALDPTSFSIADILLSLEQFLGDPTIPIPMGLVPTVTINGNTISIIIQGD